jgi:hypothetical protein
LTTTSLTAASCDYKQNYVIRSSYLVAYIRPQPSPRRWGLMGLGASTQGVLIGLGSFGLISIYLTEGCILDPVMRLGNNFDNNYARALLTSRGGAPERLSELLICPQ